MRPDFALLVRQWLKGRKANESLWPRWLYRRAAEMLRKDLKAAGIPYNTAEGIFDFHALRAMFITNLVRAGVNPKIVQKLARHSTITLTMDLYTKLSDREAAKALKGLPKLA